MVPSLESLPSADRSILDEAERVRQKYAEERSKRLRSEGVDQYVSLNATGDLRLKGFLDDPWDQHDESPIRLQSGDRYRVAIMGAGYGGLLYAARLLDSDAGLNPEDLVIIDTAAGFGGTWYWNRYPGIMCDTESYVYMPLLEETGYMPKHKYAYGEELREHADRIAKQWKIEDRAMFRTELQRCTWNDDRSEWNLDLTQRLPCAHGASTTGTIVADFVILSPGLLNRPKLPLLPGLGDFNGPNFLAARWDYAATGGSPSCQHLDRLRGKKVGIVGTGATAVQIVPALAEWCDQLYVFQRTPASVDVRGQRQTDSAEWTNSIRTGPGWQQTRCRNFLSFGANAQPSEPIDMVSDAWTSFPSYSVLTGSPATAKVTMDTAAEYVSEMHKIDLARSNKVRERVDNVVKDRSTAAKLKAWYPGWCKRPTFHDEYLEAFNRANVHLIDTDGRGVDRIAETGIVANRTTHQLDVIVFSTGFEAGTFGSPARRCGAQVFGRGGRSMDEKWKDPKTEDGQISLTLHGMCSRDFPNMFFTSSDQAGIASIFTPTLDAVSKHVAFIVSRSLKRLEKANSGLPAIEHVVVVEPTSEAEASWALRVLSGAASLAPMAGCTPSYFNAEAKMDSMPMDEQIKAAATTRWPRGLNDFMDVLDNLSSANDDTDFDIRIVPNKRTLN
ncbi:monooxygenase [Aspergillus campestris IBT 28561]|uniref:Monooxygenase n=1 Tax=Aspergillus campestris (strain IBT 28561) TaxID=1392248 RepID=A0A2I1CT91_ASPC2|nr:monooxygenase [Aspergillus campestris IBT 28561]PKY00831.1 monooxygenase [Aspergillus campestris IBT 28561]